MEVSADEKSKAISNESSAAQGESVASAVISNVPHLSPSNMLCHFSCKECHDLAKEPVLNVICGHLFCWSCLCRRLTPPDHEKRGFLCGCPYCKSHLDISPAMSTVIPVYSGPEPGVEFSLRDRTEPELDEEEESKREEAIRNEGKVYIPRRPAWRTRSRYTSKIDFVTHMLFKVKSHRADGKCYLKWTKGSAPNTDYILCHLFAMDKLIEEVRKRWLWLRGSKGHNQGNEHPSQPVNINRGGLHIALVPTDVTLPDISTFTCVICKEIAFEPVVTVCGHLFCWACLWNIANAIRECPKCNMSVNLFASRAHISSIYCEPNDHCKEDEFLKSSRKGFRQEIQAPCRPADILAASFVDRMIKNIDEGRNLIKNRLHKLNSNNAGISTEQMDEAYLEVKTMWDVLYANLVNEWRQITREQVEESKITPTLLDCIPEMKVKSKDANRTVLEYSLYCTDYIGHIKIN